MNAERWQAIGDLFEQALPLAPGARTALLEDACGADADLRREVVSLLASYHAGGGFIQKQIEQAVAIFDHTSGAAVPPARVGPYRLIRELGRGGMGTVFLAERDDDEYHARVAVKLVRPGMDTAFILARFRRERQTLARLHHPNISRLLDGGTTDAGLPYFVMEFIDGPWLTVFADEQRLTVDERLRIFVDVCAAVDYAHRNFIIHRDLKPGNILVDADRVPKLLDFGICKLLRAEAPGPGDTVAAPMTPNYASPEQIHGGAVTLLSDVYSLGAVLYELLTGCCPRQFAVLTPAAIEAVSRTAIIRPSAAAADPAVARRLKGDLDNIVMRALDSEPQRRYESAAQLADDLRRYLDHEPVHARPPTIRYRAAKFARRHRVPVAAAAAVFLALAIGLAVSLYEFRIASSRLRQIRTMADALVFDVHDAVRDLPGSTRARQLIVQTALRYLDSSANAVRGDAAAEKELAKAYRRLGDVQGNVQVANLGDSAAALTRYRQAAALLDAVLRRTPQDFDAIAERLLVYARIGTLQAYTGKIADAAQTLDEGIRLGAPFAAAADPDVKMALAAVYRDASETARNRNDYARSFDEATRALGLYEAVGGFRPADADVRYATANAYAAVGMAESGLGRLDGALAHFRQATTELERLASAEPRNVTWSRDLMLAYGHVADVLGNPGLQNLGDRDGALRAYRQAAAIGKRLYDADPADQRAAADYGIVLSRVETMIDERDRDGKRAVQQESIRVLEAAARISPGNLSLKIYLALVYQHLGDSWTAAGDVAAAHDAYLKSESVSSSGVTSGHAALYILFIQINHRLALNAVARGHRAEALAFARRALEAGQNPPAGSGPSRALPRGLSAMALTYAALLASPVHAATDRADALAWLGRSLEAWRTTQAEPGFGAPHRREMHDVELAMAAVRGNAIESASVARPPR